MLKVIFPRLALIIFCSASAAWSQVLVTANSNHRAMLASTDPKLSANKTLVYNFWRDVIEAGHVELASQYMAESYIQHNPNIATGRDSLLKVFGNLRAKDISDYVNGPLVSIVAEGDLVVLTWVQTHQDPVDRNKSYTTTGLDMFRVENGKLAEHWDAAPKISNASTQLAKPNAERSERFVPLDTLKKYLGLYQLTPDFQLLITLEENQLRAQGTGSLPVAMYADSPTTFFLKETELQIDFVTGENNQVTQLILHKNGRDFNYVKLADQF